MSAMDPKSADDLRAIARKSRTSEGLKPDESAELTAATNQSGSLARELKDIRDGKR